MNAAAEDASALALPLAPSRRRRALLRRPDRARHPARRRGRHPHDLRRRRARPAQPTPLPWSPGSTTSGGCSRARSWRRAAREDLAACRELAAQALPLGAPGGDPSPRPATAARLLYPTLERSVRRGRAAGGERSSPPSRSASPRSRAARESARIVAPLGVGGHVDHRIVRAAAERAFGPALLYYEEFPYIVWKLFALRRAGISGRSWRAAAASRSRPRTSRARIAAIACYASQVTPLFRHPGADRAPASGGMSAGRGGERLWRRPDRQSPARTPAVRSATGRVAVTGGAGFIGSHLCEHLVAAGDEVLAIDDLSRGRPRESPGRAFRSRPLGIGDARHRRAPGGLRPAALVHLAAQVDARRSLEDPVVRRPGEHPRHRPAARAPAVTAGVERIVFASSAAVYGDPAEIPTPEEAPLAPLLALRRRQARRRGLPLLLRPPARPRRASRCASPTSTARARSRSARPESWRSSASGCSPASRSPSTATAARPATSSTSTTSPAACRRSPSTARAGVYNVGDGSRDRRPRRSSHGSPRRSRPGARRVHGPAVAGEPRRSALDPSRAEAGLGFRAAAGARARASPAPPSGSTIDPGRAR